LKRDEAIEIAIDLQKKGRHEEARQIYQDVLVGNDKDASTTHLLGLTYLGDKHWKKGIALIERAIELKPARAVFHFNLGVGRRNHGDFKAANSCFHHAIELNENYGEAWAALVAGQRYTKGGEALARVLVQLQQPLDDDNQRFFQFAAAKIYEDTGDHEAAFRCYQQGNDLIPEAWNEVAFGETCRNIKSTFSKDFFAHRQGYGLADAKPIFIVGMPRSGSSLAEQILASHPLVFGAGELSHILAIVNEMSRRMKPPQPYPAFIPFVQEEAFAGFGATYRKYLDDLSAQSGLRSVDKMPSNFLHIGLIRLLFPQAKIIHSRRHPLDTCLSCYFQNFAKGQGFSTDLETLGRYFNEYSAMMRHWHEVLPEQVFDLDYETLVDQTEPTVRKLLEFCDLPWDERCLDFTGTERRVSTASAWQVRQPLHNRSMGRWRHYEQQLAPLKDIIDIDL
jgi:tetratricopeptide (TPR) repeat protein